MAGNDLQFVISVDIAKPRSPVVDVLMTDPVKSVTANPELLGKVHRECVVVSLGGDAAVKGSVENGYLPGTRKPMSGKLDPSDIRRVVQRRQFSVRPDPLHYVGVYEVRMSETPTSVNHPVAYSLNR